MTPQERRGKRLYLFLATLIILEKLAGVGVALPGGLAEVPWLKSLLRTVAVRRHRRRQGASNFLRVLSGSPGRLRLCG